MTVFKNITTWVFVLAFSVYAISPIVVSLPSAGSLRPACFEDATPARLMILEALTDGFAGKESALGAQGDDSTDILLRKKRTITSGKVVLVNPPAESAVLPLPSDDIIIAFEAVHTPHSSDHEFTKSGISPPALS